MSGLHCVGEALERLFAVYLRILVGLWIILVVGVITEPTYPMVRLNIIPALEWKYLLGCPFPFTSHPYMANFSRLRCDWTGRMVRSGGFEVGIILSRWRAQTSIISIWMRPVLSCTWILLFLRLSVVSEAQVDAKFQLILPLWITTTTDKLLSVLFNELENPLTRNPETKIYRWSIYDNPFFSQNRLSML